MWTVEFLFNNYNYYSFKMISLFIVVGFSFDGPHPLIRRILSLDAGEDPSPNMSTTQLYFLDGFTIKQRPTRQLCRICMLLIFSTTFNFRSVILQGGEIVITHQTIHALAKAFKKSFKKAKRRGEKLSCCFQMILILQ